CGSERNINDFEIYLILDAKFLSIRTIGISAEVYELLQ
ncbi:MAG: hypothetical protein ACI9UA_006110, partial [Pseudoalteromonas tetraodonis]